MSLPRYPEYKDSGVEWLGPVPTGWAVTRLMRVASVNADVLPESTSPTFEIEYVDIGSVSLERGIERTERLCLAEAPSRARRLVLNGDVIISTVRTYLKAIAPVVNPPVNMVVSTGFAVIRPGPKLSFGYTKYALQAAGFIDEVISRSTGVSYPAINASDLVRIAIPVPPSVEQTTIVAFLDRETAKIDALITEQEKLIALLAEKRQATISHAVTRGLDPNVPLKDSGVSWIGDMPKHWRFAKLGYFTRVENGTTPSRAIDEYWIGGDIPWLASGEVNQLRISEAAEFITTKALEECSLRVHPIGTVVVGLVGQGRTRGMAAILNIAAAINQNLAAICPRQGIEGEFTLFVMHAVYGWLREAGRGGNQAAMNCEMLSALRIPVPPVPEQHEIISYVNSETYKLDSIKVEVENAIALLKERRSALIAAAVTGQIDVRQA